MRLIEHTPRKWAEFIRTRNPITESIVPINPKGSRAWSKMTDRWIMSLARWYTSDQRCKGRNELQDADKGLYWILWKRKLLGEIGLDDKRGDVRSWAEMKDEELVVFADEFTKKRGIKRRSELERADLGLYSVLRTRKLLNKIDLKSSRRDWASMNREQLLDFAKRLIENKGIEKRRELVKIDRRLYDALRKRKMLDDIGLDSSNSNHRDWASMSDDELVVFAKEYTIKNDIGGRGNLQKTDKGLYEALRTREVLDDVFSDIESSKHAEAVQGVLDALGSFGDDP